MSSALHTTCITVEQQSPVECHGGFSHMRLPLLIAIMASAPIDALEKYFSKFFQKPLDKLQLSWYNIYIQQMRHA